MSKRKFGRRAILAGGLLLGTGATLDVAEARRRRHQRRRFAADPPWIGLLHSTSLESDLQDEFFRGLQDAGFTTEPGDDGTSANLNVFPIHIRGKYSRRNVRNIQDAAKQITDAFSDLRGIACLGGLVAAQAVASHLSTIAGRQIPLITAFGRRDNTVTNYAKAEGFYFDDIQGTGSTRVNNSLVRRIADLTGPYGVPPGKICYLYNDNSAMGTAELEEFNRIITAAGATPLVVNAIAGTPNNKNSEIEFPAVYTALRNTTAQAVLVSSDPFFAKSLEKIVRQAGRGANRNLIMAYPVMDYHDEAKQSENPPTYLARGPKLAEVYYSVGKRMGERISNPATPAIRFTQAPLYYQGLT
jgi:hypothetical protein